MFTRAVVSVVLSAAGALVASGCTTLVYTPVEPAPAPQAVVFSFAPESEGEPTDVTVGIVGARYAVGGAPLEVSASALATEMRTALSRDVQRVLVAKGFPIAGEFTSIDQMTFPQKDRTTMVLVPTITLSVTSQPNPGERVHWQSRGMNGPPKEQPLSIFRGNVLLGGQKYEQRGRFTIRGSIDLELHEPLTGEKLWLKDVPITERSRDWTWYYWREDVKDEGGNVVRTENPAVEGHDGRDAAMSALFADAYRDTMTQLVSFLSRDELIRLKADADRLKKVWRAR